MVIYFYMKNQQVHNVAESNLIGYHPEVID